MGSNNITGQTEQTEERLSTKVEEFRSKKEVIKAQYTAAEAQVRIKENLTGISEEMADVGVVMNTAEDKTAQMKAKPQALDEMIGSGISQRDSQIISQKTF